MIDTVNVCRLMRIPQELHDKDFAIQNEILLVVDVDDWSEVNAKEFNEQLDIVMSVLTKIDGDTRWCGSFYS